MGHLSEALALGFPLLVCVITIGVWTDLKWGKAFVTLAVTSILSLAVGLLTAHITFHGL